MQIGWPLIANVPHFSGCDDILLMIPNIKLLFEFLEEIRGKPKRSVVINSY